MGYERTDEDRVLTEGRIMASPAEIGRRALAAQLRTEDLLAEQLEATRRLCALVEDLSGAISAEAAAVTQAAAVVIPDDPAAPRLDPEADPADLSSAAAKIHEGRADFGPMHPDADPPPVPPPVPCGKPYGKAGATCGRASGHTGAHGKGSPTLS